MTDVSIPDAEGPAAAPWPAEFEKIIRQHVPLLPPSLPLAGDIALADNGLDSLGVVSLLVALEDEFDVVFPDELLAATTFGTPKALWAVLQEIL